MDEIPTTYINRNGMKVRINVDNVKPDDVLWEEPKEEVRTPEKPDRKPARKATRQQRQRR